MPTDDVRELNERYLATLREQRDLRRRGFERLRDADRFPPVEVDDLAALFRSRAGDFDGHLLFFGASDFGHPVAFVPDAVEEPRDAKRAVLDALHREGGKWQRQHEGLHAVRDAAFEASANLHKGLPALVHEDGVDYDLEAGVDGAYNFVTIRQVAGLLDWVTESYQAEALTTRY